MELQPILRQLSPRELDEAVSVKKSTRFSPDTITVDTTPSAFSDPQSFNDDANNFEGDDEVTAETINLWLRRAVRKFLNGVPVIRVTPQGKLVKRQLFIGAKPEYVELISAKLFDIAYHVTDITGIIHGVDSIDFRAFRDIQPDRVPKKEKSLVLTINDKPISLVFMSESDRRDAQMLLLVERQAASAREDGSESPGLAASEAP